MNKFLRAHIVLVGLPLAIIALLGFRTFTFAADAAGVPSDASLLDLARPVFDAFSGGHYAYAGALLVILLVAIAKRYLAPKVKFLNTDAGGAVMALALAMATAMAAGLAAPGAVITSALLKSSALIGVGAAGGYTVIKDLLIEPLLRPLIGKLPIWAQPIGGIVLWVFEGNSNAAAELAAADKAGADAVTADPAKGVAAVLSKATINEIK